MAIAFRAATTLASGTRTNSTVTAPAGSQAGDVIVVSLECGGTTLVTPTAPGGWTLIESLSYSAPDPWAVSLQVFYHIFSAGETSWTFTHASRTTQAYTMGFSGVDNTTPIDVAAVKAFQNQTVGGSGTATAPALTIATAGARGLLVRGSWDGNAITPPSGWTERLDAPVLWVGERDYPSTGTTGTVAVPAGNGGGDSPWGVIHGALRPAGGGGATVRTASGGVTLGGTAPRTILFTQTASGGVTLSGTTSNVELRSTTASGGATLSGTATRAIVHVTTATGTLSLSGSAPISGGVLTRTADASLLLSGAAPRTIAHSSGATGALTLSGTAEVSGGTLTRTATGALTLSGEALTNATQERTATGSLSLSGTAVAAQIQIDAPTGTLTLSGTAERVVLYSRVATGTLGLSGTAPISSPTLTRTASGAMTLSGVGDIASDNQTRNATGTLALGGTAPVVISQSRTATGSLVLSGTSTQLQTYDLVALGSLVLSGTAEYVVTEIVSRTARGALTLSGVARIGTPPVIPQQRRISGTVSRSIKGPKVRTILSVTPKVG